MLRVDSKRDAASQQEPELICSDGLAVQLQLGSKHKRKEQLVLLEERAAYVAIQEQGEIGVEVV